LVKYAQGAADRKEAAQTAPTTRLAFPVEDRAPGDSG